MNPKYVRSAVDRLLADLAKDPRIGRPSLMRRYGRPVGFGLALGLGGITGCGSGSSTTDALPPLVDVYGADSVIVRDAAKDVADALPLSPDAYGMIGPVDVPPLADVADALPGAVDVYAADRPFGSDAGDAVPVDSGKIDGGALDADKTG
jgi:hypothetical protein